MEEIAQPVVQVERPEGVLRVAFVDGAEVAVSSDSLTANRVEYAVMVRFRLDGEAWVPAGAPYISRPGMRLDSGPSWSARKKIIAAAQLALEEALEADPKILKRGTAFRLQREIASQKVLQSQAAAKSAEIHRGIVALQQELYALEPAAILAVYCSSCGMTMPAAEEVQDDVCPRCGAKGCMSERWEGDHPMYPPLEEVTTEQQEEAPPAQAPTSRYIFGLGATDDDVMVCVDVVAQTSEEAIEKLRAFLKRDPSDPFVVPGFDGVKELRFYLNAEPTEVDDSLIDDCEELA